MTPTALYRWLARVAPVDGQRDPDLDRALAFLGVDLDSETVTAAATGTATLTVLLSLGAMVVLPGLAGRVGGLLAVAGAALAYAVYRAPRWLATARRTRALGDATDLVGRAVLQMRLSPTSERAAAFAARRGAGPLAASLREHRRRARGTPRSGWRGFADEWADWNADLRRAVRLVTAAADARPGDRSRLLDRALAVVLDGTRDRMAAFAAAIKGPTSGIYAFGVVLPLALVSVLPAARAAGLPVGVRFVVAAYDVVLPGVLVAAAGWLLGRRPAAFPPAPVSRSHPDVPDRRATTAVLGPAAALAAWLVVGSVGPDWLRWVVAPGTGVGAALVWWYRPVARVRERVAAVEDGLTDALAVVGQRLREGAATETAVAAAADELGGPAAATFAEAARVQRQLRVGVREAFLGDHGALRTVPSPRVRTIVDLVALAGREGAHGGRLLVELADHVDDLLAVEREARRDLASVTGTLRSTALVFAPLVAGTTVSLAGRLRPDALGDSTGFASGTTSLPVGVLGVAVGVYVLLLAVVLAALAVGLERGLDRSLVGYHVGVALLSTSVTYPAAVVASGMLV
ncbi:type II secretion system protein [Halobacteriaceae archaeon GCM10025711]